MKVCCPPSHWCTLAGSIVSPSRENSRERDVWKMVKNFQQSRAPNNDTVEACQRHNLTGNQKGGALLVSKVNRPVVTQIGRVHPHLNRLRGPATVRRSDCPVLTGPTGIHAQDHLARWRTTAALAGWLSCLEHRPVHHQVAGLILSQGT